MTLRYYDVLEKLFREIEIWRMDKEVAKEDVLDTVREYVLMLMTHVVTTPLIGTAYAYPGDIQGLDEWFASTSISTTTQQQ